MTNPQIDHPETQNKTPLLQSRLEQLEKTVKNLQNQQKSLIKALMLAPLPVAISSVSDSCYLEVNDSFLKKTSYRREEVIGQSALELVWVYEEERTKFVQALQIMGFVSSMEVTLGGRGTIQNRGYLTGQFIEYNGQACIISMFLDMSDYDEAAAILKKSEERLFRLNRALLVKSKCGEVQVHAHDEISLMQDICRVIIEVGGYRLSWVGLVEHDEAKSVRPVAYAGYEEGYLATVYITWSEEDPRGNGPAGQAIRLVRPVSAQNILEATEFQPWRLEALKRGYASSLVLPLISEKQVFGAVNIYSSQPHAFDEEEIQLLMEMADNLAYGIISLRQKIERQRVEAELRQSEEKLRQAQKMEAIGRLAGGIAHDFNNLLTAIFGYTDLLLLQTDPNEWRRDDIIEIDKAAQRAAALTQQLLAFSRKQILQPKIIDLNSIVFDLEKMLRRVIGEDVELVTVTDPQLGQVKADPGQIEQVIMNLVVNARDAMPRGGKLIIETTNIHLDKAYASRHIAVEPGHYVQLTITDSGEGVDEATLAQIFEPFFTTKERGKGTGLGLSTVYGIVKQSGGNIWVYSEVGLGSSFKIYLPRVLDSQALTNSNANFPKRSVTGSETILLAEDDVEIRKLMRRILKQSGYNILDACNGAEAFKLYKETAGDIHLVITDLVMPVMGGLELATQLRDLNPKLHFLFTSGYSDRAIDQQEILTDRAAFMEKPFTINVLTEKVRRLLDEN